MEWEAIAAAWTSGGTRGRCRKEDEIFGRKCLDDTMNYGPGVSRFCLFREGRRIAPDRQGKALTTERGGRIGNVRGFCGRAKLGRALVACEGAPGWQEAEIARKSV